MNIEKNGNKFFIGNEDKPLAELNFSIINNVIFIDSVFVVNHLQGQGIASNLIKAVLNYCAENNLHFEPICSITNNNGGY